VIVSRHPTHPNSLILFYFCARPTDYLRLRRNDEAEPRFGFSFIRRDGERRLSMLTPEDPYDDRPQSFSPFKQMG
jgi:hypothetical protein